MPLMRLVVTSLGLTGEPIFLAVRKFGCTVRIIKFGLRPGQLPMQLVKVRYRIWII